MGEIADSILDGDFCQVCGEYIGDGDGFPQSCPSCRRPNEPDEDDIRQRDETIAALEIVVTAHGYKLHKHTEAHWTIRGGKNKVDVFWSVRYRVGSLKCGPERKPKKFYRKPEEIVKLCD